MRTGSIGPGTFLAGRYRLEDLLAESEGARFWRATDTILARSVAIHAVLSDDPRAAGLLDAARVSATITDPHLLRVLDCDDEDGITWVVNEWGEGISLDLMLEQGTLPPSRAAWLAREVAEAIAAGHAQGVAHGRLNPEAVLVTHAGAVKLIGYVVDASLEPRRTPDPLYGELDDREADVINLAGILYAALTGRWPGVARSAVPTAPRESRRPLRPRQVRAGVPRTLDAICERVLHKEGSRHAMPIETAHEIAAALADYVGDPGLTAPLDAAAMHAEPVPEVAGHADPPEDPAESSPPDPESTQVSDAVSSTPEDPPTESAPRAAVADPDATQTFRPPVDDDPTPTRPRTEHGAPLPGFPDLPERPLFAPTQRRVPAGAGQQTGQSLWAQTDGHGTGSGGGAPETGTRDPVLDTPPGGRQAGFWPFELEPEENDAHTGKEGRGWLRVAIAIGVLLVLVVAMAIAFTRGRDDGATPSRPTQTASSSPAATAVALKLTGVSDFDPMGDPPEENPKTAKNAIDGNPATSWQTSTYRGNAALGGLKSGVGLIVDLGGDHQAKSVTVEFKGTPTSFEVYAASSGVTQTPRSLDQLTKVGARANAPERATVALDPAPTTRYVLIWLTRLPAVSGGFRGEITGISVRS